MLLQGESADVVVGVQRSTPPPLTYLRLRERSLTAGDGCDPSSSTLSVLRKCLNRKWRSSCVGWKGNWCSSSWDEEDWKKKHREVKRKDSGGTLSTAVCNKEKGVGKEHICV